MRARAKLEPEIRMRAAQMVKSIDGLRADIYLKPETPVRADTSMKNRTRAASRCSDEIHRTRASRSVGQTRWYASRWICETRWSRASRCSDETRLEIASRAEPETRA